MSVSVSVSVSVGVGVGVSVGDRWVVSVVADSGQMTSLDK